MILYLLIVLFFISSYDKDKIFNAVPLIILLNLIFFGLGQIMVYYFGVDYMRVLLAYNTDGGVMKIWTAYTSSLVHKDVSHLFSNMLVLVLFNSILKNISNSIIWKLYFFGNLIGIFSIYFFLYIFKFTFHDYSDISSFIFLGASAGIFSILGFLSFNYPFKTISLSIFKSKVIYVTFYLLILSIFAIVCRVDNTLGHVSHMGGFLFAYYLYKTNRDNHVYKL
jgi:membrane associated rhomboid family serine protease